MSTILKRKLNYDNRIINYSVIRSKRVKTSEIIVDADSITVRTPFDKSILEIEKIILGKASWILKKQVEYNNATPEIMKATFKEGATLPYLGKNYRLRIIDNQDINKGKIELINGEFLLYLFNSKYSKKKIKSLYEEWLMQRSESILGKKVDYYSKQLEVQPSQIIIKNLKNRWGSTTKYGIINLNVNLVKASEDVIDYIVFHELSHLKIKEHSHHLLELIHRFMPNYKDKIDWLQVNERGILNGHTRGD